MTQPWGRREGLSSKSSSISCVSTLGSRQQPCLMAQALPSEFGPQAQPQGLSFGSRQQLRPKSWQRPATRIHAHVYTSYNDSIASRHPGSAWVYTYLCNKCSLPQRQSQACRLQPPGHDRVYTNRSNTGYNGCLLMSVVGATSCCRSSQQC